MPGPRPQPPDERLSAKHEAGHAVMAILLHHKVTEMTVTPSGGSTVWRPQSRAFCCIMERGLIAAAGMVAQSSYSEEPTFDASDFADLRAMGFGGNAAATLYMLARAQLARVPSAVDVLAEALLSAPGRRLKGAELRRAVDAAIVEIAKAS